MGKPKKTKKSFNYQRDRRKSWTKSKKMPTIHCKQIRQAWNEKKTLYKNMKDMGLSADPNTTLKIPRAKDLLGPQTAATDADTRYSQQRKKSRVVEELEEEANAPQQRRMKMSEPDVDFCIAMIDKYGDDYKAMARDALNYFQETPKQIGRKIRLFRSIPEQYNAYLASRSQESS
ncbi:hypothetical protein BaRGS_00007934 [Batillaria attramentaria]|uniref:Nucleolar protein 16 n=1 Tax=Batillaria attramentaria TaxID=370345 RepID=A0ABD0LME3_9CAEN